MANDTPRGALFRVPDDEKKNDRWPDFRGDLTVEGRKWKLAGWTKEDKNGRKYLSLVARPAEDRGDDHQQATRSSWQKPLDDDSIPFEMEWR